MAPLNSLNGQAWKQPASGLRGIKRDWSDSQAEMSSSQDSGEIFWPPSPERPSKPKPAATNYAQGRLARIQAALEANQQSSEPVLAASSSSSVSQKRPLAPNSHSGGPATKKRVLPSSWESRDRIKQEPQQTFKPPPSTASSFASASIAPRAYVPNETDAANKVPRIFLSNEQQQILKLVEAGNNVFFTGSAGTGKSVLLREIIKSLRKKFRKVDDAVAITASTGIAACNIGGVTLHSFGGIGLGIESAEQLATKIRKNKKASTRWLRTQVLIIDEVSMVEGDLFDKLARIACIMRKNSKLFGGIQLIISGDFFQLPPVTRGQVKFAFEAQLWTECIQRTFNLTKVFRQKDQEFVDMLNEMRFGRLTPGSIAKFKALSRPVRYDDGVEATELFPRREDVDRANKARMQTLRGEMHTYFATDGGLVEKEQRDKLLSNLMAPPELQLRIDSQVMLIKNTDETLVNGSMGRVVRFVDPATWNKAELLPQEDEGKLKAKPKSAGVGGPKYPLVHFPIQGQPGQYREVVIQPETWKIELPNGEVQASRSQLPLILAWAMSIHKSQGQTLDRVKVDLGKVFEKGQAYVALSRATSLQGLQVLGFDANKVQAHPKVAKWSTTLESFASA